jgi:hypothetical protein
MKQQNYPQGFDQNGLVQTLETSFRNQGYDVQDLHDANNNTYVQIKKGQGKGHKIVGIDRALTVRIQNNGTTNVSVGQADWASKTAVEVIGLFVFWPLIFTGAYGLYQQERLPGRVWKVIDDFAASKNVKPTSEEKQMDEVPCPNCGVLNSSDARYCNACGDAMPAVKAVGVIETPQR